MLEKELENTNANSGLINLTLVDSFYDNTAGANGINEYTFTPKEPGMYTILAYATGNNASTAIYKNNINISTTFLTKKVYHSSFTFLTIYLDTTDIIKINVQNQGGADYTRQYWIYN